MSTTELETYVIAGPLDPEDGTLYWSNADGWGFISTATVFTEAEYDNGNGNLPLGDDARWIASSAASVRLDYLRGQIRAECISMGEVIELQGLVEHIQRGDVELLEWAGVPEDEARRKGLI